LRRQIGIIADRKGAVEAVICGNEKEIVIPPLTDRPLGRKPLRGVRCVHTHLKNEPLTEDDLADLALLRFDCMAAIGVAGDGLPKDIHLAHVVAPNAEGKTVKTLAPVPFHEFDLDMKEFISSLEDEIGRAVVRDISDRRERAILVSVATGPRDEQMDALEELKSLSETAGVVVLDTVYQRPKRLDPRYLMGAGKLRELVIKALQKAATLIVFAQELAPAQMREIAEVTELKVIDRTQLILDIFARRAHTRDGKVQVELAQLKYILPKLTGKGTALSRLAGGIGGRGPGETKLEVDRRRVQDRIARLERELDTLGRGRLERRRRRGKSEAPIISIVGYTNAGKSTLLNALTKSATLVEDKLFATLDTATRRLRFPRERNAIITDTVGFIRDMPEELKKAFRSTLEEMTDADLLIHLVDASDGRFDEKVHTVEKILDEVGLSGIPRIMAFNKIDLVEPAVARNLAWRYGAVPISAEDPATFGHLLEVLEERLWPGQG
jgi:GTP-binding protein HflX